MKVLAWFLVISAWLSCPLLASGSETDSARARHSAAARILEHSGEVSVHRKGQLVQPESWATLSDGDSVQIYAGAKARISFASGEVVEKSGPAVLIVDVQRPGKGCSLLGMLSLAARALIFGTQGQTGERPMAVRGRLMARLEPMAIPPLLKPHDGELLSSKTVSFVWQSIAGVDLYQLSLYDAKGIIWQATTPGSRLEYSGTSNQMLEPSLEYHWRVEAIIGDSHLSSRSSSFTVGTPAYMDSIQAAVAELCTYATDAVGAKLLAAEVYFDVGLYTHALEAITFEPGGSPSLSIDRKKADILLRLEDHVALEALMLDLLNAKTPQSRE